MRLSLRYLIGRDLIRICQLPITVDMPISLHVNNRSLSADCIIVIAKAESPHFNGRDVSDVKTRQESLLATCRSIGYGSQPYTTPLAMYPGRSRIYKPILISLITCWEQ